MKSAEIAKQIAWLRCEHKNLGMDPCIPCVRRFERYINDYLDSRVITAAARYFEPKVSLHKITPLTWGEAYDITKIVLNEKRKLDALSR